MATNVEKKDDGAKKSSGLRSTRKLFAKWTGLRHAVKRTTKALVGPREPAREPPRILVDSTYAKRTFKKAELEKLFEKRKKRAYDLAPAPADLEKAVPDDVEAVGEDATVVIDAGSFLTRIGLTGEGEPRMVVASVAGQQKRAKFPTSKAHISAVFHSFRLIFGRSIISRNGLEAWMLFPERARAEHSR